MIMYLHPLSLSLSLSHTHTHTLSLSQNTHNRNNKNVPRHIFLHFFTNLPPLVFVSKSENYFFSDEEDIRRGFIDTSVRASSLS